jgi:OOP family OmpA-OmpF porin
MKSLVKLLAITICIMVAYAGTAQVKIDVKKKVSKEANQRANKKTDKAIDKSFDAVEDGVGSLFKKKDKKKEGESKENTNSEQNSENGKNEDEPRQNRDQNTETQTLPQEKPVLTWAKYDFVPGDVIIFEDNLEGEVNGEFPSKWNLKSGTVENATLDGLNIIWFRKSNSTITPLMKVQDYLPEEFTIEFDYLMLSPTQRAYHLFFMGDGGKGTYGRILFHGKDLDYSNPKKAGTTIKGDINAAFVKGWKHAAISFNKRALKVYVDEQRVLNIPNVEGSLKSFSIGIGNAGSATEAETVIKNVRVAKGAVPLYDKVLTDGKFVTTGIKFDVNKATIKAESMGTINYVVKMMNDNPGLNFVVEGHTDSDGEDAKNSTLSESRAKAICDKMKELGIGADRLKTKGWGESKPVAGNDTPEGKAQNRRVEFVKF